MNRELFMRLFFGVTALFFTVFLASCGGGGGGGSPPPSTPTTPGTQAPTLSTAKYAGFYLGACEKVPDAISLEDSASLYGRLYQVVQSSSTDTALLEWRLDLYDNNSCSGEALGYVENKSAASKVTVLGQTTLGGKTVDKVKVVFGAADSSAKVSSTSNTVVIGKSFRLSLPASLFSPIEYSDVWLLEAGNFFDGSDALGADGFPVSINTATPSKQQTAALAKPPEPCAAKAVSWRSPTGANLCSGTLSPKASGVLAEVLDAAAPATGAASYSCNKGIWSEPVVASCSEPTPARRSCPQATLTWTVGEYTCSGQTKDALGANIGARDIANTTPGTKDNRGSGFYSCTAAGWAPDSTFAALNSCAPAPPPTPPIRDPLLLAEARNCLLCHGVTTARIGPSFKTIADFYRSSPPAAGVLEAKIKKGGIGVFGDIPMPANGQVSNRDLAILVPWILSQ